MTFATQFGFSRDHVTSSKVAEYVDLIVCCADIELVEKC
jgi:hypothetical protein